MKMKPRPSLQLVIDLMEKVNPVIVLASIIGLVLEFTAVKDAFPPLVQINGIIDIIFLADFVIRLFAFPPKEYLLRLRLERACVLLHHSAMSIEEIAASCGICDRNYLTRLFKRTYGLGPATYRKQGVLAD